MEARKGPIPCLARLEEDRRMGEGEGHIKKEPFFVAWFWSLRRGPLPLFPICRLGLRLFMQRESGPYKVGWGKKGERKQGGNSSSRL